MLKALALIALCTVTSAIAQADIQSIGQIFCAPSQNVTLGLQRTDRYTGTFIASGSIGGQDMTSSGCEESATQLSCDSRWISGGGNLKVLVSQNANGQIIAQVEVPGRQPVQLNCHK